MGINDRHALNRVRRLVVGISDRSKRQAGFMNRLKWIVVWILRLLLAILFAIQGIIKLNGSPGWISKFSGWGYPDHFYLAVGVAELLGAVGLLIPRLANSGALLLVVVMIGATATHVVHRERQVITTLVLLAVLVTVLAMHNGRLREPQAHADRR
jgi:putative oxidoreductase